MPAINGVAHVGLTVRNLQVSQRWYRAVFGLDVVLTERTAAFDSAVLRDPLSGLMIVLRQHHGGATARFDEKRTGLDHLAFAVMDRTMLDLFHKRLTDLDIDQSPIQETDFGWVIVFRDPDHIQLELFCPDPNVVARREHDPAPGTGS